MTNEILDKAKKQMEEVLGLMAEDLKRIKTGRAKPSLIEDIKVQAYGTLMSLKELASITTADPQTLVVSPWDKTVIEAIEKAINTSDLNLHGLVDNDLVRIKIPSLTEETRQDLVKLLAQKLESGRRLLRQVRNEVKKEIEDSKGQPGVSEDDLRNWLDELQELIDEYQDKIDSLGEVKEKELMSI
jgi:ribosome recycling factor